jgi:hypothetical protein
VRGATDSAISFQRAKKWFISSASLLPAVSGLLWHSGEFCQRFGPGASSPPRFTIDSRAPASSYIALTSVTTLVRNL